MLEQELQKLGKYLESELALIKATFSKGNSSWIKVTMRPIILKGQRFVQFSYYDKKKCTVKNYNGREYTNAINDLLNLNFKNIFVETSEATVQLITNKKGEVRINEKTVKNPQNIKLDLEHNRAKKYLIPDNIPSDFLEAVGIMTKEGKVKADKQNKFRQLNGFLKIIDETFDKAQKSVKFGEGKLLAVDCGCGNAYLTFAAYDYFNHIAKKPLELMGVDINGELLENHRQEIAVLDWDDLKFKQAKIIDYIPERDPDLVMSLHACDTATDEALFKAISWGSKMIFASPCCHHNVQTQLESAKNELKEFAPILRHGALKERFGDVLTDTFRILILRIAGYQSEIVEFVDSENTNRNLLIRAVKSLPPKDKKTVEEYLALKRLFKVEPYLEKLLGKQFI